MTTHEHRDPGCRQCRSQLEQCRQRLRAAGDELNRTQAWLESRALRLDRVARDLREYLDGRTSLRRSMTDAGEVVLVEAVRVRPRKHGDFDVFLDQRPPFHLSPMLARLLQLLAEDGGRDMQDGLVGFKSRSDLLSGLAQWPDIQNGNAGFGRPGRLRQAIHSLRKRLAEATSGGETLIHTRRNIGFRLAVRKPDRR